MPVELTIDDLENIYNLLDVILDQELVEDAPGAYIAITTLSNKIRELLLISTVEHITDEQYKLAHLTNTPVN